MGRNTLLLFPQLFCRHYDLRKLGWPKRVDLRSVRFVPLKQFLRIPSRSLIRRYEATQLRVLPNELQVYIERIIRQHDMLVELTLEPNVHAVTAF